jgi:hypothetical protein
MKELLWSSILPINLFIYPINLLNILATVYRSLQRVLLSIFGTALTKQKNMYLNNNECKLQYFLLKWRDSVWIKIFSIIVNIKFDIMEMLSIIILRLIDWLPSWLYSWQVLKHTAFTIAARKSEWAVLTFTRKGACRSFLTWIHSTTLQSSS